MLGHAGGDALGTTVEFEPPGTFEPLTDMVGGGPFDLAPGEWTDDTSMALCLAESLVETGGFDPVDQLERYVRWWRHGDMSSTGECFDIGIQTSSALAEFERTGSATPATPDSESCGNGSIMRLAPVPLFFAGDLDEAVEMSGRNSLTTHPVRRRERSQSGLCVGSTDWSTRLFLRSAVRCILLRHGIGIPSA
jgi:ADP-ribosyl-[dinitrogen reductase] hydrolase